MPGDQCDPVTTGASRPTWNEWAYVRLKVLGPQNMTKTSNIAELQEIAKRVRRDIVTMITAAKSGHPGGSLSSVEILVSLYFDRMRHDPANPQWEDRDHFILSKGHAAPVLYSVLAECGYTPKDELNTLRKMGSIYQGHPDVRFIPILDASTGSLGEGLSFALGLGSAAKLDGRKSRVYCVLGDGEIQEGQIWEAAMYGAYHNVNNVVPIVDSNRIQLDGFVQDIMAVEPLEEKWRSFGYHVISVDGHDIAALQSAWDEAEAHKDTPSVVIAHTVKGKGVSFMEDNPKFHGTAPSKEELEKALLELA